MRSDRPTAVALAAVLTAVLLTAAASAILLSLDSADQRSETLSAVATAASTAIAATAPPSTTPPPTATNTQQPPSTDAPMVTATPQPPTLLAEQPTSTPHTHPSPTPDAQPAPPPRDRIDDDFASRVLALVNAERTSRGIPALQTNSALVRSAQSYARTLLQLDVLGHDVNGTSLSSRVAAAGYSGAAPLGEVLWASTGYLPPERTVADWMASPAHRQIILDTTYSLAGVGCVFSEGDRLKARCVMDLAG